MMRHAFVSSTILALALLASGCQAIRDAGGDAAEGARDRMAAWWASEGRDLAKREAGALAEEAKRQAVEAAARGASEKVREVEERLSGHGVESKSIDSLAKAWDAYRKVREEEERSGKPYAPITGNLLVDIMIALFGTRYLGKGVDKAAAKIMKPDSK